MRTNWMTTPTEIMVQYAEYPARAFAMIGTAYWTRNMVLLYLPPHLTKLCVWYSVYTSRFELMGKIWGYAFLAPAVVPTIMPYVGWGVWVLTAGLVNMSISYAVRRIFPAPDKPDGGASPGSPGKRPDPLLVKV